MEDKYFNDTDTGYIVYEGMRSGTTMKNGNGYVDVDIRLWVKEIKDVRIEVWKIVKSLFTSK